MLAEFTLVAVRPKYDFEKNKAMVYRYMKALENLLWERNDLSIQQFLNIIEMDEPSDDETINQINELLNKFATEVDKSK